MFNFVYETPCGGMVTGLMRLGNDGTPEMFPLQNLGGGIDNKHPDLPTDGWLPMDNLGTFDTPEEMEEVINQRQGWSLIERGL